MYLKLYWITVWQCQKIVKIFNRPTTLTVQTKPHLPYICVSWVYVWVVLCSHKIIIMFKQKCVLVRLCVRGMVVAAAVHMCDISKISNKLSKVERMFSPSSCEPMTNLCSQNLRYFNQNLNLYALKLIRSGCNAFPAT